MTFKRILIQTYNDKVVCQEENSPKCKLKFKNLSK